MAQLPAGYRLAREIPALADYQRLRADAGLTRFADAAAAAGLRGTYEAVVVREQGRAIAMGRIVGDGGLFFQLVDIAVEPRHQGRGIGKAIVAALLESLAKRLTAPAYVSLIADGAADRLYEKFGFVPVAPKSRGMALWLQASGS